MTTRPPWRSADVTDAILGRSTRPSLRHAHPVVGGVDEAELYLPGIDEVIVMLYEVESGVQLVLWPMRLGYPREDH